MKNKYRLLLGWCVLYAMWIVFVSNQSNPPNGRTNAPFDSFCTGCHSPSSAIDGTVDITGIPDVVEASETYEVTLTVEATLGSPVRAGFQLVSVFDDASNAGDFDPSSGTGTNSSGGREYIEHRGARNFSNGTVSWTFDWTAPDGPDGSNITMYYAGNITNGNGSSSGDRPRSGNTSFTLSAGAQPLMAVIESQNNVSCNGGADGSASVSVNGGVEPYSYDWSSGDNTAQASDLVAGEYVVTITDDDGTEVTAEVTITEPDALAMASMVQGVLCNGDNSGMIALDISGGTAPYDYEWSNGMTDGSIENLPAGNYQVTVTDDNQCTLVEELEINEPDPIQIEMQSTDETANMGADGTAQVSASGGSGGFSYLWSNGETTASIQDLEPGSYTVTVTDGNDCTAIGMVTVQAFTCSMMVNSTVENITCFGESSGSISLAVSEATQPVTFNWSTGATVNEVSGLTPGMYDVTVEDGAGCQEILAFILEEPDSIVIQFGVNNPSCPDDSAGSITAIPEGGVGGFQFAWSSGGMTDMEDSLPAGNYSVTVSDANGCMAETGTSLVVTDTIPPIPRAQTVTAYLDQDGIAILDPIMLDAGSSDNCGIDSLYLDLDTLDCGMSDTVEVFFSARDAMGNISDTLVNVIVLDTVSPVFDCIEDIMVDSGDVVTYIIPDPMDNCAIDSIEMTEGLPSGSVFPEGETKVSYMATDASGNIACCSFFVHVGTTTSTDDQEILNQIQVFPNPATDQVFISLPEQISKTVSLSVFDALGKARKIEAMLRGGISSLDVAQLPAGIYFLQIRSGKHQVVKRLQKI